MMDRSEEMLAKITDSKGQVDPKALAKILAEIDHYATCAYQEHIRQGNY